MSIDRDIRRILMTLSRFTKVHGRKSYEVDRIVQYLYPSIPDNSKIRESLQDALIFLEENGLITKIVKTDQTGICACKLSPYGELVYQELQRSKDSILVILKKINRKEIQKINFNVTDSNIAVNSSNVNQNVYVNKEISELINKIVNVLKNDKEIPPEIKQDTLIDIDTLKSQLLKKNKNNGLILTILNSIGSVASISSLVMQLISLIK
ncbi:MAG: hypothetical protein ABII93_07810 [Chrysiogenia bacterium]